MSKDRDKPLKLNWIQFPIHTLGISITDNEQEMTEINYRPKIKQITDTLNIWNSRTLTLKGKITIINTLIIPKILYIANVITTPTHIVKELEKIITKFIWNNKPSKIAKHVITQKIENAGLKMVDITCKIDSLKIGWLKRLIDNSTAKWKAIPLKLAKKINIKLLLKMRLDQNSPILYTMPTFYSNIIKYWNKIRDKPENIQDYTEEIIWNNTLIQVDKRSIYWTQWINNGILQIADLINNNNEIISLTDLQNMGIKTNFLTRQQLINSIPTELIKTIKNVIFMKKHEIELNITIGHRKYDLDIIQTKEIYWKTVENNIQEPSAIEKWNEKLEIDSWPQIFKLPYKCTRKTKLQTLQYKIIHRIFPCNYWLQKIKIKESDICNFCNNADTIEHYFYNCTMCAIFWKKLLRWWNNISDTEIESLNEYEIIFGIPINIEVINNLNFIILLGKSYIFAQKQKSDDLFFIHFLLILKNELEIEKQILDSKHLTHKWGKWQEIYDNL